MFCAGQKFCSPTRSTRSATISANLGALRTDIGAPLTTLAFHVEKLHQPSVWARLKETAVRLAEQGIRATLFIYPFPAALAGENLTGQLQLLASLGHEIAQHTHFYSGVKIGKQEKVNDLSKANIVNCMQRDFGLICQAGNRPRGFTAGSWFVNDQVLDTLIDLGFVYDCSAQIQNTVEGSTDSGHRQLSAPGNYHNEHGQLLCLPTTCSLGEWFKWGRKAVRNNASAYQLVYLHDYDLMSITRSLLLACFLNIVRINGIETTSALAERYFLPRGRP